MPWTCAHLAGSALAVAIATLAIAAPASAQMPPSPTAPAVAGSTIACGVSYPAKDVSALMNFPASTVTLRSGPSDACIATGQGTHDQRAQYLCNTSGDGGMWTFLRNVSTGDQGWVRDDLLGGGGSQVPCGDTPSTAVVGLIPTLTGSIPALTGSILTPPGSIPALTGSLPAPPGPILAPTGSGAQPVNLSPLQQPVAQAAATRQATRSGLVRFWHALFG